jgi:quercetin dioxygenase-like cupin family protein
MTDTATENDRKLAPTKADFVPGGSVPVQPVTSIEGAKEAGHLGIKALMVGEGVLVMEAHREKGLIDPEHSHEDHESICYLVSGRMRVVIAGEEFIAEPGDIWKHRPGVLHYHETLEDSLQIEIKSPARKTWS